MLSMSTRASMTMTMSMTLRLARRTVVGCRGSVPLHTARPIHWARPLWISDKYPEATISLGNASGSQDPNPSVEGYQGDIHQFSEQRAQHILDRASEEAKLTEEEKKARMVQGVQGAEESEERYKSNSNVSLHGVMQSMVPEPPPGSPNNRNMPNHGGILRQNTQVASQMHENHPSRKFSSYPSGGAQGGQDLRGTENRSKTADHQGIQGNETLDEGTSYPESGTQGGQDLRGTAHYRKTDAAQGIQGATVASLRRMSDPCPQGVQGHDCDRFRLWLDNCVKHGIPNCDEQLQGVQSGRKTLSEIFAEQDELIARIGSAGNKAAGQLRHYSTEAKVSGQAEKPSRKEQLKYYAKEYGWPFMAFYITFSLGCLGCTYAAVASGIDVAVLLQKLGVGEKLAGQQWATGASTMAIAYPLYKLTAPIRLAAVIGFFSLFKYLKRVPK